MMMMMMCARVCVLSFLFFFLTRLKNQAFFPFKKNIENPKQKGSLFPEGCKPPFPQRARRERETERQRDRETEKRRGINRSMGNLAKGASSLVGSPALVAAMLAFTIAQICKVFTHYHTTGKVDWGRLVGSGGMPSSHTALVVGLTTAIGLKDALDSSIFALCLVFSLVVRKRLVFVFRSGWDLLDRIFSFSLSCVLTIIVQSEGLLARAFLKPSSPSLSD
jgi:Na+/melibiose symporter-like transporter